MRRWLQLGLASTGMGVALLGFSLVGPDPMTAGADTGAESAASSEAADSGGATKAGRPAPSANDANDADATDSDDDGADAGDDDADDEAAEEEELEVDDDGGDVAEDDDLDESDSAAEVEDDETVQAPAAEDPSADVAAANLVETPVKAENTSSTTVPIAAAATDAPGEDSALRPWSEVVEQFLDDWTTRTMARIDSLNVSDQRKLRMEESFYAMRRALFNQAPTVDPVQITGVITGPITGAIYADDVDDDRIVYRIVRGPETGSLRLHADGTYTYTPGEDFTGVDTFTVMAIDAGLHINLLNLFRPIGTQATSLVNQGAIKFDFNFSNDPEREIWTPARVAALQQAADQLTWYFRVAKPVVLSYDVVGSDDSSSLTLASARGELMTELTGFVRTRLQNEIITGEDTNGDAADGFIDVNFGHNWSLGPDVGPRQSDFVGVLMHEILHSFGWGALPADITRRALYASMLVTRTGEKVFNDDTSWNPAYNYNAVGQNGGLYFGGANAVEAYGGLVPVFTPPQFSWGSSISHLDDLTFIGDTYQLMDATRPEGLKLWTLSDLELAILKDLGYTVAPLPNVPEDEEVSTDPIDVWTTETIARIDGLQVSAQTKLSLEQSFYAMRRALFNRAPSVDPVQLTGVISGAITGTIGADDVDDDRIVYRIVDGPKTGSLRLHADGTYTYTPGENFDGVDTFSVVAIDAGLHVNVLNLFRPLGTRAENLINHGAVKFEFNFTNDPEREVWNDDRVAALQQAADQLVWYVRVPKPVLLTYDVVVSVNPDSPTHASAFGELMPDVTGFVRTRLQHEIITGEDTNGAAADGNITVNFGRNWSLGPDVHPGQVDFIGVMMHELLHSWGWGNLSAPGPRRALYSSFLVATDEGHIYNDDTTWNTKYDANAYGLNGGIYFNGPNVVKEYGTPVPVFTPRQFSGGSSIHHLDDYYFVGESYQLMNALRPNGLKLWTLSDIEVAILKDLGYNAVQLPQAD